MWRTLSTAYIKGIEKTVTLAQAVFSLLGYTFFGFGSTFEIEVDFQPEFHWIFPLRELMDYSCMVGMMEVDG